MAAAEDPRQLALSELPHPERGETSSAPILDERDREAEERDREADGRDREAEERDHEAKEEDQQAEAAERRVPDGVIDLRERRRLTLLRHKAAAERQQAALDRAAAAADRKQASFDRQAAAHWRAGADEEREILQRDELTGVLQRGAGLIALEREIARSGRSGDPFVVAFIDVDGLKRINDENGHGSGDEALRTLGETLRTGLRSYDLALRYGGDEFVCILPGFGAAEAAARFRLLQGQLASGQVPVSVTFGVAEWKRDDDVESLLTRADAALYEVRRQARGREGSSDLVADETTAVAAHRLLNSSAVVSMSIMTLLANWDAMQADDRVHLLQRMLKHASSMDDRLKGLTQGRLTLEALCETSG